MFSALSGVAKSSLQPGGALALLAAATMATAHDYSKAKTIYEFTVKDIHGQDVSLSKYKGNVCLIVNVASK
jgi:hypothetical protein